MGIVLLPQDDHSNQFTVCITSKVDSAQATSDHSTDDVTAKTLGLRQWGADNGAFMQPMGGESRTIGD